MTDHDQRMAVENPAIATHSPNHRRWRIWALIGICGLFLLVFEIGRYRTLTKHESFVAVVSRGMLTSGDWVVPRFANLPRLKKPPLAYWTAATWSAVFGTHAEWTVRLPSVLAALMLAGLLGYWASRWYGHAAGVATALVQLSAVFTIDFGRKAEVDMQLCLITTTALFLIGTYRPGESRVRSFWRWAGVLSLVGLSWLAKFHYGPAMILSVCGVWFVSQRWWRSFWNLLNPLGLLVILAAVLIWPYLVLRQIPDAWEIWQAETVGRAIGQLGRQPVWFYLPQVVALMLPWSLLLPWMWPRSLQRLRQGDERERFLWIWFCVQFAILTASAFKHHHYLMAALPAVSLTLGRTLSEVVVELRSGQRQFWRGWVVVNLVSGCAITAASSAVVGRKWPHLVLPTGVAMACLSVGLLAASVFFVQRRWRSGLVSVTAGFGVCYVLVMGWIFPSRDGRLADVRFAAELTEKSLPAPIRVYGLKEHPVVYYLPESAARVEEPNRLSEELESAGRLLVVTATSRTAELSRIGECRVVQHARHANDTAPAKGEPLALFELRVLEPVDQLVPPAVAEKAIRNRHR